MDEVLRRRIERKLEGLPEELAYQVLDYIEFLESRYGSSAKPPPPLARLTEAVGDTLRAARLSGRAIEGTMNAVETASRLMRGLVAAGRAAVAELRGERPAAAPPGAPAAASPSPAPSHEAAPPPAEPPRSEGQPGA